MRERIRASIVLVLLVYVAGGCTPYQPPAPASDTAWLRGSTDERFDLVAKHLRGFDMAMVETGYRYTELYWAGREENWGYAAYQLGKIRTAIANGIERRPRRAASARMIDAPLAAVETAIQRRDRAQFLAGFETLTAACNACHRAEGVGFVTARPPEQRPAAPGVPTDR